MKISRLRGRMLAPAALCAALALFAVAFLGAVTARAQVKSASSKPVKPSLVWGVQLPSQEAAEGMDLNLYGQPADASGTFWDNGNDVTAVVQKLSPTYPYEVYLFIKYPSAGWAHFRNLFPVPDENAAQDPSNSCGFPDPFNTYAYPECIWGFLNGVPHPQPGYVHFMIHLYMSLDIYDLPLDTEIPLPTGDWGQFFLWNMGPCDDPVLGSHPYHTIVGQFSTNDDCTDGGQYLIKRTGPAAWSIRIVEQKFKITEEYCALELFTAKNKKPYYAKEIYYPFTGWAYPVSINLNAVSKSN
jgi:hypothetical protein